MSGEKTPWPRWLRLALYSTVGFLLVFACISALTDPGSERSPSREPDELDAYLACQGFMSERLRAPATARYPLLTSIDWAKEGNVWGFEAYVDAENTFGAKLRTRFNCQVRWDPGAELWRLENLEIY